MKIGWFSLRYGVISIFKMAAVRDHPRSLCCWPQLPVEFHVNLIHRPEDIAVRIFRIFAFNHLFRSPKWGFGGTFDHNCDYSSSRHPKDTSLCKSASVDVSHVKIGSAAWALGPWKDFAYKEEIIKKLSGNFGYMGRSNPWGDLDHMWRVWRYGGRNHVCSISWLSVKVCGCGERGKFAFSHWLDASPLQHWSH